MRASLFYFLMQNVFRISGEIEEEPLIGRSTSTIFQLAHESVNIWSFSYIWKHSLIVCGARGPMPPSQVNIRGKSYCFC